MPRPPRLLITSAQLLAHPRQQCEWDEDGLRPRCEAFTRCVLVAFRGEPVWACPTCAGVEVRDA